MTRTFSGTEMCRTRPVTVTYALPDFWSAGAEYSFISLKKGHPSLDNSYFGEYVIILILFFMFCNDWNTK